MKMNRVFIGVDHRQPIGYNVLQHSIHANASRPVQVVPLYKHQLPITRTGLTDFTFSRYLVPWLCDFTGTALFMDADMIVLGDINELFDWHANNYNGDEPPAVSCVMEQPEFEWPSLMLFDNWQCKHLTPEYVNDPTTSPGSLSKWTHEIGVLPSEWNVMVLASDPDRPAGPAKVLHFTEGLPCFHETQHTPGAVAWHQAKRDMLHTVNWKELMGRSIHAQPVLRQLFKGYTQ
jgi:hypothetical protein